MSISELISVCLMKDYSLSDDLHIFVYGRAECATVSLECTKVKLLILNNFGSNRANSNFAMAIMTIWAI